MTEKNSFPAVYHGLPNSAAKAYFLVRHLPAGRSVCFISQEDEDDFIAAVHTFAPKDVQTVAFHGSASARSIALYHLCTSPKGQLVLHAAYEDFSCPLPSKQSFLAQVFTLHTGDTLHRQNLLDHLERIGYTREDYAESAGQYAARGSVVDVFSLLEGKPLRFYFAGKVLESIYTIDVETQTTQTPLREAVLLPLSFDDMPATLAAYTKGYWHVADEPSSTAESLPAIDISFVPVVRPDSIDAQLRPNMAFQGNFEWVDREVASLLARDIKPYIYCLNRGEMDRLGDLFQDYEHLKRVPVGVYPLTQGFISLADKKAFITSNELFNRRYHVPAVLKRFDVADFKRSRLKELEVGDYVVHRDYGIGRYLGLQVLHADTDPTDCLLLEYRRGTQLYVPIQDFKKVQKYIGTGGKRPSLAVLGGVTWKHVKERIKKEAQKDAQEILKQEALRQAVPAPQIIGDARMEQEFADSFPFELTAGQEQAITQTLHDLDLPKPMDRVLVGDVGFGKTEVALRAALKVVLSGKQVLLLVPTTILADQHHKTFLKRLAGFPVNVRMLCRFQTPKEQRQVVAELKSGLCDIIIGTHRLLSKDIAFKDLGLVIIDEEHRFGVKQKEKIRAKSAGVHCLLLSATPIPRTLNQSLSSLRDISLIDTPPRGRNPIKTVVTTWDDTLAAAAITRELARNGQVYYVYNSVQSMETRYLFLKKLVPHARICMAHGQMDEKQLEQTLWDFNQGKYDILLASTIIESGIDITNANTLIVENAHMFGLAQLYQLRGRIGRGDTKAYCYLFHPAWLYQKTEEEEETYHQLAAMHYRVKKPKETAAEAKKRLAALMEFGELGSGFRLALRDMEIRGAGQLLGVRQHGQVNEVGLSYYCDLVAREVQKLRGERPQHALRTTINLPVSAYIPADYLPDDAQRLNYYKAFTGADEKQMEQLLSRLRDLCGPVPEPVHTLAEICLLAEKAGKLQIYHMDWIEDQLEVLFTRQFQMPSHFLEMLFEHFGAENVRFVQSKNGDGLQLLPPENVEPLSFAQTTVAFLIQVLTPKMV